jgi:hypothetical protein
MRDFAKALAWLHGRAEWWTGAAMAREQLAEQAASDKEADEHHRMIAEYQRRAIAAGRIA